jgi:HSP20 family protein
MAPYWPGEEQQVRFTPDFEVRETKEGFLFKADVPGIKEQDLEVTMTGNRLTISGKREAEMDEKTDTYYTCERSYGSFTRAFTLPADTDAGDRIRAELKEGVLTVLLPRKPELQPKRIDVKVNGKPKP